MNILSKKVTYSFTPNSKVFNALIDEINNVKLIKTDKDKLVLLMNEETARYLVLDNYFSVTPNNKELAYFSCQGINVAIANWLETGEVLIYDEVQVNKIVY